MLEGLDGLKDLATKKEYEPSPLEYAQYLFFTYGIPLDKFEEMPIPYIMSMVSVESYLAKQQKKGDKKKSI